jgi:hypothetical protein
MPSSILEWVRAIFFARFVKEFVSRVRQQKVLSLHTVASREGRSATTLCADSHGFQPACRGALRRGSTQETRTAGLYITRPATTKVRNAGN